MKYRSLLRDIFREIRRTRSKFLSIFLIIALGTGFFAGIKAVCPDMKQTAEHYYAESGLMDLKLLSTYGVTESDMQALQQLEGVEQAMAGYSVDALVNPGGQEESIVKVLSYGDNMLNKPVLLEGRMPDAPGECVVEQSASTPGNFKIGETVRLASGRSDKTIGETLSTDTFEIVGIVQSPLYIAIERGNSDIGNGKIGCFMLVPEENFVLEAYTEAYVTLSEARAFSPFDKAYDDFVDGEIARFEAFGKERAQIRYDEVTAEPRQQLADAKAELEKAKLKQKEELEKAQAEIDQNASKLTDAEKELARKKADYQAKIAEAKAQLDAGYAAYDKSKKELAQKEQEKNETSSSTGQQLEDGAAQLAQSRKEFEQQRAEAMQQIEQYQKVLDAGYSLLDASERYLEEQGLLTEEAKELLEKARTELAQQQAQLDEQKKQAEAQLAEAEKQLVAAEDALKESSWQFAYEMGKADAMLQQGRDKLGEAAGELAKNSQTLADQQREAEAQFADAQKQIDSGKSELEQGKHTFAEQKASSDKQLSDAAEEIAKNEKKLNEVEMPKWYVLDRSNNPGYADYGTDAERVDNVAAVFPVFFILVAVLVCLTTMTRMVEEQRTQIGTLKALGYGKGAIMFKYLFYAASASLLGSVVGLAVGMKLFPIVIFAAYSILYRIPAFEAPFKLDYAFWCTLVAMLCVVLSAFTACFAELMSQPAKLMRPKSPPSGKRVLLERVGFLWKRLSFIQKVTVRNIFRYKKRVLMTVVGIAGCTALMLTGFGLQNSISSILPKQFGEIFIYDAVAAVEDDIAPADMEVLNRQLDENPHIQKHMGILQKTYDVTNGKTVKNANLFVPQRPGEIDEYVTLRTRVGGDALTLPEDGVVITEKLAKMLDLKAGSAITINLPDGGSVQANVSGVTENYASHYVYLSPDCYERLFGKQPVYNCVMMNTDGEEVQKPLSEELINLDHVLGVSFVEDIGSRFRDVLGSLNYVVLAVIISAGVLAFIVLYNLVNINVSERIRELATIKVLGFYDGEVSAYVYRENIACTFMGIGAGLIGGIFLEHFVVQTAEVDMVMFMPNINPMSFVWAGVLTLAFTLIVNVVLHFTLKKIDMVESLKSIE